MTTLTWHETWNWRIEPLDLDHRHLVKLLAEILRRYAPAPETMSANDEGLTAALDRLGEEARLHFRLEAEVLQGLADPDLAEQLREHALLMAEYIELARRLREQGARRLDREAAEWLKDWLLDHIVCSRRDVHATADHAERTPCVGRHSLQP